MKYILVLLFLALSLFGSVIKSKVASIDEKNQTLTIKIEKIDVGMSGFVVHQFTQNHSSILNNVVVTDFNEANSIATLKMSRYDDLVHSALPKGKWTTKVGDDVVLAYGYSRAVLIAPNEDTYYRITKSAASIEWVHPDIFATILSFEGHPTPLKNDFDSMAKQASIGLFFFYLDQKLYTLEARSFIILNISDAPLVQDTKKLPFYMRIESIDAAWWGEGSDELEDYEPHYYELMVTHNPKNKKLYDIIKNGDEKLKYLLDRFDIKE